MTYIYQIRVRLIIPHHNKLLLEYTGDEDYYFYPGGRVENYETVKAAAEREMIEEINAEFKFEKILYIREFIEPNLKEHSLELFVLGKLANNKIKKNKDNPDYNETHQYGWFDIDKQPENLYPITLTKKLVANFHKGFPRQGEYLGAIK